MILIIQMDLVENPIKYNYSKITKTEIKGMQRK